MLPNCGSHFLWHFNRMLITLFFSDLQTDTETKQQQHWKCVALKCLDWQLLVIGPAGVRAGTWDSGKADSSLKWLPEHHIPTLRRYWAYFCTMEGYKDMSSIFIYVHDLIWCKCGLNYGLIYFPHVRLFWDRRSCKDTIWRFLHIRFGRVGTVSHFDDLLTAW